MFFWRSEEAKLVRELAILFNDFLLLSFKVTCDSFATKDALKLYHTVNNQAFSPLLRSSFNSSLPPTLLSFISLALLAAPFAAFLAILPTSLTASPNSPSAACRMESCSSSHKAMHFFTAVFVFFGTSVQLPLKPHTLVASSVS